MMYTFNQYYLTTRLAGKATHDTYLSYAMHDPGHKVLLKIYKAECLHPDMAPTDFQSHAAKLKSLSHPHIVPILDIGIEEGKLYVVSEYFPAGSLRQLFERATSGPLFLDTALAFILDVGSALRYAHSQDFVHQKVRPENILLNAQDQALLADFSLHELINEIVLESRPDDRAMSYMAPEQLAGSASPFSDQYALACLFYESITGKLPFTARDLSTLRQRYILPSPIPPSQFVATLPKQVENVVLKALSKKTEDRYTDIETFQAALQEAVRPAPPAFPFEHIIPRTDHHGAIRIPSPPTPAPAAGPASAKPAAPTPKKPESDPVSPASRDAASDQPSSSVETPSTPLSEPPLAPQQETEAERAARFPSVKSFSMRLGGIKKISRSSGSVETPSTPLSEPPAAPQQETEAERAARFPSVKSFSMRLDSLKKASRSSIDQKDQSAHRNVSMSFPASIPPAQPFPAPGPRANPAPAPAVVPGPIAKPVVPPTPMPVSPSVPANVGTRQSVVGRSPVPASPVSSAQPQKSPVAQHFPLSKLSYALLSLALICIVATAFFSASNHSIVQLMNNPASFPVSATPAPAQPAPPVVANPPAQIGMPSWLLETLTIFYQVGQVLYFFAFATMLYYFTRPINWVSPIAAEKIAEQDLPRIILLYPVLRELEATMRTTFLGLSNLEYPPSRYRVIAIPNSNDGETIASLRRLVMEFPFLEVLEVPPTKDPRWETIWQAWEANPKAYWWHQGKYRKNRDLPPKKTRQLIYAFYTLVAEFGDDWVLDYIDADSVPPTDHFMAAVAGMRGYDVLQSTNVAGNLLDTWPASFHAMDHIVWDGLVYPHMSANGKHPFWVLGKGLFYKAADVVEIGSFNPWVTIEDPEVGMRLWTNGKTIGMIANPLIEEVPVTLKMGIIQRSRWICGFFQSLSHPLKRMGMSFWQAQKARLNLVPCLSLTVNAFALPLGIWALYEWFNGTSPISVYWAGLAILNIISYVLLMMRLYIAAWQRTALVLTRPWDRVRYLFRVNPIFLWIYWLIWIIPIVIGFQMFLSDRGREWIRTEKVDANHALVRRLRKVKESANMQIAAGRMRIKV